MKKAGQKTGGLSLKFMSVKFLAAAAVFFLAALSQMAAAQSYPPSNRAPKSQDVDLNLNLRQLKTELSDVAHEVRNQEAEIRMFENKLKSQESLFEHFRKQLTDEVQSQKDFARASFVNLEGKAATLDQSHRIVEEMVRGITADVRQIKTQANDSIAALGSYKQKISELETVIKAQGEHMQNLENALHSMMEAWQAKEAAFDMAKDMAKGADLKSQSQKMQSYKVQPGDNLEKIARSQKVSVQALRDANPELMGDRIIVGQTLKIP